MTLPPSTPVARPRRRATRVLPVAVALLALPFASACGGGSRQAAPEPGQPSMLPPSLVSQRVMVFPVQSTPGVDGPVDDELRFALEARGDGPVWTSSNELRRRISMSPSVRVPLDQLPVEIFLRGEVRRIGDPLYGQLRRAAALTDATIALIPVQVAARPADEAAGTVAAIEVSVALVEILTGRVLWYGVEEGVAGAGTDPAALATAMEAMARRLVPRG